MTLDEAGLVRLLEGFEKESKAFREEALRLSWYMRGGLTYDDAMMLSAEERDTIGKIIKENMEITKKSGIPFF